MPCSHPNQMELYCFKCQCKAIFLIMIISVRNMQVTLNHYVISTTISNIHWLLWQEVINPNCSPDVVILKLMQSPWGWELSDNQSKISHLQSNICSICPGYVYSVVLLCPLMRRWAAGTIWYKIDILVVFFAINKGFVKLILG